MKLQKKPLLIRIGRFNTPHALWFDFSAVKKVLNLKYKYLIRTIYPLGRGMLIIIILFLMLNSCIGISSDIHINKDGSGKITVEYRYSRMAETIGRLDGNEKWQIIPTGRADWERTTARIDGMKLASFSSGENDKDIVNKVTLEFKNTDDLLKFLDASGKRAFLNSGGNSNILNIILNEPVNSKINQDLLDLMKQVSAGYKFKLSFSSDKNSAISLTDGEGKAKPKPEQAEIVSSGKKVSLSVDMGEILNMADGLGVSISW